VHGLFESLKKAPILGFQPDRHAQMIGQAITANGANYDPLAQQPGIRRRAIRHRDRDEIAVGGNVFEAESLQARCHLVSYGGRGILRDWQGLRTVANAPQFYELCHPDIPGHRWDHSVYVPDVIGVALGTNDFNQGIPDQNEFVNTYVEFVRKLRRDAPMASLLLIESPIVRDDQVNGPRRSVLRHYLEEIKRKAGDPKLSIALLGSYAGIPGDGHPSGTEHKAIALELLPYFRLALA
jgi:hypothetical protein